MAKPDPEILQQERQPKQEKPNSGITRRGNGFGLMHRTVRALNAETPPIHDKDFWWRPHDGDEDICQPFELSLAVLVADGAPNQNQAHLCSVAEGVAGSAALAPNTQRANTALFSTYGTGNDSRSLSGLQVADEFGRTKAFVQIEAVPAQADGDQTLEQALKDA